MWRVSFIFANCVVAVGGGGGGRGRDDDNSLKVLFLVLFVLFYTHVSECRSNVVHFFACRSHFTCKLISTMRKENTLVSLVNSVDSTSVTPN